VDAEDGEDVVPTRPPLVDDDDDDDDAGKFDSSPWRYFEEPLKVRR